jgi:hypothetical protein
MQVRCASAGAERRGDGLFKCVGEAGSDKIIFSTNQALSRVNSVLLLLLLLLVLAGYCLR